MHFNVYIGKNPEETQVEFDGYDKFEVDHRIKDLFGIKNYIDPFSSGKDDLLWSACNKLTGRVPNGFYSARVNDNCLTKFPIKAKVIRNKTKPQVFVQDKIINNEKHAGSTAYTTNLNYSKNVTTSISTTKSHSFSTTLSYSVETGVTFPVDGKATYGVSFTHTADFSKTKSRSVSESFDFSRSVKVMFNAGDPLGAEKAVMITGLAGAIDIEVEFKYELEGSGTFRFNKGHFGTKYPTEREGNASYVKIPYKDIFGSIGKSNIIMVKEVISMGMVGRGSLEVKDLF